MKKIITIALVLFSVSAFALPKPTVSLKLYPDGQDGKTGIAEGPVESNGLVGGNSERSEHVYQNVTDPFINIYMPKKCNGQMLVVLPGGGYQYACSIHEGEKVAKWAMDRNIAACVLVYRMPNKHHKVPLIDVQNTFRYLRRNASSLGINQIGIIGFSAGGHLAASASTLFTDTETRPDFSILIYPVIDLVTWPHSGTKRNLLGENSSQELSEYYSLENRVTPFTPTAFIAASSDDKGVNPVNSILYYEALLRNSVNAELHLYSTGGHGWGFGSRYDDGKTPDNLGSQRKDFDAALERWLKALEK